MGRALGRALVDTLGRRSRNGKASTMASRRADPTALSTERHSDYDSASQMAKHLARHSARCFGKRSARSYPDERAPSVGETEGRSDGSRDGVRAGLDWVLLTGLELGEFDTAAGSRAPVDAWPLCEGSGGGILEGISEGGLDEVALWY